MKKQIRFVFSLVGLAIGISSFFFFFRVRSVECVVDEKNAEDLTVCKQLSSLRGSPIFFRDFSQDSSVLNALYIEDTKEVFHIQKVSVSLDGRVRFLLTQSPPLYRVTYDDGPVLFAFSGETRQDDVRVIVPEVTLQVGTSQDLAKYHPFLVHFLQSLPEDRSRIQKIEIISPIKIKLKVENFPQFLLELNQDPVTQAQRFHTILHTLEPKEIDVAILEIDLRFELPVLRVTESSDSAEVLIDSQE